MVGEYPVEDGMVANPALNNQPNLGIVACGRSSFIEDGFNENRLWCNIMRKSIC